MLTDKHISKQMDQQALILNETSPGGVLPTLSNFKLIGRSIVELESGNQNIDGWTDGLMNRQINGQMEKHHTHQSNRQMTCLKKI